MARKDMDFARAWARRYIREHHPHGLDASDVENMILRRLRYNKDKGERGRKAALSSAMNEAQDEGRRNFRALVPWTFRLHVLPGFVSRFKAVWAAVFMRCSVTLQLAEGGGFEPPVRVYPVRRFSKPLPSATQPSLQTVMLDAL